MHKSYTNFANFAPNKKRALQAHLQGLKAQEEASPEAYIAEIEQLTDQMKKDLEEYLYG